MSFSKLKAHLRKVAERIVEVLRATIGLWPEGSRIPISNPSMPSVPDGVHVDDPTLDPCGLLITAHTTTVDVTSPSCRRPSTRMHSAYWRTLKDLPWQDGRVQLRAHAERILTSQPITDHAHRFGRTFRTTNWFANLTCALGKGGNQCAGTQSSMAERLFEYT